MWRVTLADDSREPARDHDVHARDVVAAVKWVVSMAYGGAGVDPAQRARRRKTKKASITVELVGPGES